MKHRQAALLAALFITLLAGCASGGKPVVIPPSEPAPKLFGENLSVQVRVVRVRRYKTDDFLVSLKKESPDRFRSLWMTDMGLLLADFTSQNGLITVTANPGKLPRPFMTKVLDPMLRTVFSPPGPGEVTPVWQSEGSRSVLTLYDKGKYAGEVRYDRDGSGRITRIFYDDKRSGTFWELYLLSGDNAP